MILLPASAELAANAGTGPEGHKRSTSVDSGASSDATIVVASIDGIDGATDGSHKSVATGELLTSPPEPSHERATNVPGLALHAAKRGRVSTDTASGAPALATHTTTAGSPTAAAPITVSIDTATALAVADFNLSALNEPNEASDAGHHEAVRSHSARAAAARDVSANSAGADVVMALGTPASASSAIVNHSGPAPASASAAHDASALGTAACKSATIDANPASRGDTGCPETPLISGLPVPRSHVVAPADPVAVAVPISVFAIGRRSSRTSTPTPAPGAGGSRSAVIVANATSRVHAHCPPTPVVSRMPAPRSHTIAGATAGPAVSDVGNNGRVSALRIGLRYSATSATAPTPAPATTPAALPIPATAPSPFEIAGSRVRRMPSQISRARSAVSRVIQRGMGAIRNALVALFFKGDIEPTDGRRPTSHGPPEEDRCWDEGAPIDAALLVLSKRQRRRFL